jgi:hypothetical protein
MHWNLNQDHFIEHIFIWRLSDFFEGWIFIHFQLVWFYNNSFIFWVSEVLNHTVYLPSIQSGSIRNVWQSFSSGVPFFVFNNFLIFEWWSKISQFFSHIPCTMSFIFHNNFISILSCLRQLGSPFIMSKYIVYKSDFRGILFFPNFFRTFNIFINNSHIFK